MSKSRFSVSPETTLRAQRLRREASPYERLLWSKLKNGQAEGLRFRRQHPVGPYILDFYCAARKLCVELDGDSHGLEGEHDALRTEYLERRGIVVVRFWNGAVKENVVGVVEAILEACREVEMRGRAASDDL